MLEKNVTQCLPLWRRWCVVHQDEIEGEVMLWLAKHSYLLHIMTYGELPKDPKPHRPCLVVNGMTLTWEEEMKFKATGILPKRVPKMQPTTDKMGNPLLRRVFDPKKDS
jgi:hypothetical protein